MPENNWGRKEMIVCPTLPRNRYVPIRQEKPSTKEEAVRPEYKTCKYTTEAIVTEGSEKGEIHKVCAQPDCPIHHPKKQRESGDDKGKVEERILGPYPRHRAIPEPARHQA